MFHDDLASAHAMIRAERAARLAAEAAQADVTALVAHLKLQIEKLRRELYGSRSERKARMGTNPQTKERIHIPASVGVTFRAGKALKEKLK